MVANGAASLILNAGTPDIAAIGKNGADLAVEFADGSHLSIQEFFVGDDEGDYPTLSTADGKMVASGLLAPEAGPPADNATEEGYPSRGAGDTGDEDAGSLFGDGAADWLQPLLLTGAGLASMTLFESGGTSGGRTSRGASAAAEAPIEEEDIEALIGAEAEAIPLADLDAAAEAEDEGAVEPDVGPDTGIILGDSVPMDIAANDADLLGSLVSDLTPEVDQ
ncbi:hypothetical protein ACW9UR_23300 [Halovulum sp. GXIMD14794]